MSLCGRLRQALASPAEQPPLAGDLIDEAQGDAIPAAVLVAVTDRPEPGVILTVRHEDMRIHAGQIAFPGGRLDAGEDALEAALARPMRNSGSSPRRCR